MELLAPAGDRACFDAALAAGADAVYIGVGELNARRRAANFRASDLPALAAAAHAKGARLYLALNIDLVERELGLAARLLAAAAAAGVDAVIARDPALFAFAPLFPSLAIHLSTQGAACNPEDASAARELGCSRVVLAREMSLDEIAAAGEGRETECFAQGALCACVSGRCLLSSWGGGRSGSRGACTSPCRVPWIVGGRTAEAPLSMKDLSAIGRLRELAAAGVKSIKIEGRLKNARWVAEAVGLYRRALSAEGVPDPAALEAQARRLAAYAGREVTCAYLDGRRDALTGSAGRETEAAPAPVAVPEKEDAPFSLRVRRTQEGLRVECRCAEVEDAWDYPAPVIRRENKAIDLPSWAADFVGAQIQGFRADRVESEAGIAVPPRILNRIVGDLSAFLHRMRKAAEREQAVELPAEAKALIDPPRPAAPAVRPSLAARIEPGMLEVLLRQDRRPSAITIEPLQAPDAEQLRCWREAAAGIAPLRLATPPAVFGPQLGAWREAVATCASLGFGVEANSWGMWQIAKRAGAEVESGAGLSVMNSLAARELARRGFSRIRLSSELDRRKVEDLARRPLPPCSVVVLGRPVLFVTRVGLPEGELGKVWEDRRDIRLCPRRENGLIAFRPVEFFAWPAEAWTGIADCLPVADLVGSPDPAGDWSLSAKRPGRDLGWNWERGLF